MGNTLRNFFFAFSGRNSTLQNEILRQWKILCFFAISCPFDAILLGVVNYLHGRWQETISRQCWLWWSEWPTALLISARPGANIVILAHELLPLLGFCDCNFRKFLLIYSATTGYPPIKTLNYDSNRISASYSKLWSLKWKVNSSGWCKELHCYLAKQLRRGYKYDILLKSPNFYIKANLDTRKLSLESWCHQNRSNSLPDARFRNIMDVIRRNPWEFFKDFKKQTWKPQIPQIGLWATSRSIFATL